MIRKLLIANRGEIAVRIIQACREIGIGTVAVYSDADAHAQHVRLADQSIHIGPASSAGSYLNIPAIIGAARSSRADAIHPGYGFLSQNASFAAACEEAGVIFVGPSPQAIALMGSKIDARRLMHQAGVPVVPGDTPEDQTDEGLRLSIARVGLPVLVKASAGGGGKGMRLIREEREIADAVPAARRETVAAFGDGTLYVERLIERAHHIEVQVFGGASGQDIVHLFERECSVQRRHRKVIEESPSPSIGPDLRDRITRAGITAARAVSYRNAGTVEFLVDVQAQSFYFLEMNTRLQVEHPVTEQVVGVDLVRAQLDVAASHTGAPADSGVSGRSGASATGASTTDRGRAPWAQSALTQRGHAIEARVYAEDPARGFLPQAGRLLLYREPRLPGVRIDSGFVEGDEVPIHYDPLLAKVIASAETRDLALARLRAALRAFPILGIRTNIPFLLRILEHPRVRAGGVDIGFLDAEAGSLLQPEDSTLPPPVLAAIEAHQRDPSASDLRPSWNPWDGSTPADPNSIARPLEAAIRIGSGMYRMTAGGPSEIVYVAGSGDTATAFWNGRVFGSTRRRSDPVRSDPQAIAPDPHAASSPRQPRAASRTSGTSEMLTAPMPGTVMKILAHEGERVTKGDTVVILEAMKMELPVRALDDGLVLAVRCREGDLVQADAILVELTP